jgi:hypothetical protein
MGLPHLVIELQNACGFTASRTSHATHFSLRGENCLMNFITAVGSDAKLGGRMSLITESSTTA